MSALCASSFGDGGCVPGLPAPGPIRAVLLGGVVVFVGIVGSGCDLQMGGRTSSASDGIGSASAGGEPASSDGRTGTTQATAGAGAPADGSAAGAPVCSNLCRHADNGTCEDGDPGPYGCPLGTDCGDCGPRPRSAFAGYDGRYLLTLANGAEQTICGLTVEPLAAGEGGLQRVGDVEPGRIVERVTRMHPGRSYRVVGYSCDSGQPLFERTVEAAFHTEVVVSDGPREGTQAGFASVLLDLSDPVTTCGRALRIVHRSRHRACHLYVKEQEGRLHSLVLEGGLDAGEERTIAIGSAERLAVRVVDCAEGDARKWLYHDDAVPLDQATAIVLHDGGSAPELSLDDPWQVLAVEVEPEPCKVVRVQAAASDARCQQLTGGDRARCERETRGLADAGELTDCIDVETVF